METTILQMRLKNCIQTLLELENAIMRDDGKIFQREFDSLKTILHRIDQMSLEEEEVERMETATSQFLMEVDISGKNTAPPKGTLQ